MKYSMLAVSSSQIVQRLMGMVPKGGSLLPTDLETVIQHLRLQK